MTKIRSKNTRPEILLRKILYAKGLRYRIHYKIGSTKVDLAFPSKRKAIDVHGCFWHQHNNCSEASKPKTNSDLWEDKFRKNKLRDERNLKQLKEHGWESLVIWECELEKDTANIANKAVTFIGISHTDKELVNG